MTMMRRKIWLHSGPADRSIGPAVPASSLASLRIILLSAAAPPWTFEFAAISAI